jgi:hypothetical protein
MTKFGTVAYLLGVGGIGLIACQGSRDRPTGLDGEIPETTVLIVSPANDTQLPSDSVSTVALEASGLLQAVEVLVIRRAPVVDTIFNDRMEFEGPRSFVEEAFTVTLPSLVTGTPIEIRGVAENVLGARRFSKPVFVTAVECDIFPVTCSNIGG